MLLLDTTIMSVAQQPIRSDLGASLTQIQWALDAYVMTYAVLLLTSGRLGDLFGRKRCFILGLAIFTAASAACGLTSWTGGLAGFSPPQLLIAARVAQGIGAALVIPQSMALITAAFPPERRGSAFGVWSSVIALAAVVGPILGGLIVSRYDWGWLFLINVPVGVAVLFAALWIVPESRDESATRNIDIVGIILSSLTVFALIFPIIEASHYGWSNPLIAGSFAVSAALFVMLVWWELRSPESMLRLELYRLRNVWTGSLAMAASSIGFFGMLLPLTILFHGVLGRSPVEAGLALAPVGLMIAIVAPFGGRLADRLGSREILVAGFSLAALGFLLLIVRIDPEVDLYTLLPALVVVGIGFGLTVPQINAVPMRDIPANLLGAASGQLNTIRSVSIALGIALTVSLLQRLVRSGSEPVLADSPLSEGTREQALTAVTEGRFDRLSVLGSPSEQAEIALATGDLQASFLDAAGYVFLALVAVLLAGALASMMVRKHS